MFGFIRNLGKSISYAVTAATNAISRFCTKVSNFFRRCCRRAPAPQPVDPKTKAHNEKYGALANFVDPEALQSFADLKQGDVEPFRQPKVISRKDSESSTPSRSESPSSLPSLISEDSEVETQPIPGQLITYRFDTPTVGEKLKKLHEQNRNGAHIELEGMDKLPHIERPKTKTPRQYLKDTNGRGLAHLEQDKDPVIARRILQGELLMRDIRSHKYKIDLIENITDYADAMALELGFFNAIGVPGPSKEILARLNDKKIKHII